MHVLLAIGYKQSLRYDSFNVVVEHGILTYIDSICMIYIGADHAGFELKERIKDYLERKGIKVEDVAKTFTQGDDYPDIAAKLSRAVQKNPNRHRGILVCGSGGGMSIAANTFRDIRCVPVESTEAAILSRTDNNTNVLAIGARLVTPSKAYRIVWTWLATKFVGKMRYRRRINAITKLQS